jgi:hypothetical protein
MTNHPFHFASPPASACWSFTVTTLDSGPTTHAHRPIPLFALAKLEMVAFDLEQRSAVRPAFSEWVEEHGAVAAAFMASALSVATMRRCYSARTIFESVRHQAAMARCGERCPRRIDDRASDLAKLFQHLFPEHRRLFWRQPKGPGRRRGDTLA